MLEIKNITICYKNRPTVKNFTMTLKQGEIASLVGESGSGKTTVIRAVLGLLAGGGKVTAGDILFEGKSLLKNTSDQWRRLRGTDISMIFQDSGAMLNPTRKIGGVFVEYIRTHENLSKADAWKKGVHMLERMRLPSGENIMNSYPFQLSGGMRQRIAIARAIALEPELIIMDEATCALDVSVQKTIIELVCRLQREKNIAIGFIAHDLGLIQSFAHQIAVMYLGSIVEVLPGEDVERAQHPYTKALLSAIFDTKMDFSKEIESIDSEIPSPLDVPPGCPFQTRCGHCTDICRRERPPLVTTGTGHEVACHLFSEVTV